MRRGSAAAWVFLLFSASSCLQILGVDVDKYEEDAEKPIPCNTAAECDDLNPCTLDACGATKLCEHTAVADGPSDLQLPGDCQRIDCNGGEASTVTDDLDLPNDVEPCTQDLCTAGVPSNPPLADTTACMLDSLAGICAAGVCQIGCGEGLPACDDKNPCTDDQCSAQTSTCVFTIINGVPTPGATQAPGDCKQYFCVNGLDSAVPDDVDLPDDGNACTDDVCMLGVPSNPATAPGTYCEAGKPDVCDGNKSCVECVEPDNCVNLLETDCIKRDCVNNKCVPKYLGNETTASQQQPGDCRRNVCNGTDGGSVPISDDTDLPNDNKECTADSCQNGAPQYINEGTTKKCGTGNVFVCNGMGDCVGCNTAMDCAGTDDFCKKRTCTNNVCGWNYTADNTSLPSANQTSQDCKVVVCDGAGNAVTRNDNTDIKPDGNLCTKDQCSSGTPAFPNEAIGFACNQNGGDICDGNGSCEKSNGKVCAAGAECAYNNCVDAVCCGSTSCPTCQSCNVTGSLGTCTNVAKGANDGVCTGVTTCNGSGQCKKVDGQSCSQNADCVNGFCVDGVCCQNSCAGQCKSCNVPGNLGACVNTPAGQADANGSPACSGSSLCDGSGACKKSSGQSCSLAAECLSLNCVDAICCVAATCATCQSCNVAGSLGMCTNVASGVDDGTCSGANSCDGAGSCKKDLGQACAAGGECLSGFCVDGYCCNNACSGTCQSCNLPGSLGTCTNVPSGGSDTGCATTSACNGAGACKLVAGQVCSDANQCLSAKCTGSICQP